MKLIRKLECLRGDQYMDIQQYTSLNAEKEEMEKSNEKQNFWKEFLWML